MKQKNTLIIIGVLALICIFRAGTTKAEVIRSFEMSAKIDKSSEVRITEKIVYDFEEALKHGIYRDIPLDYNGPFWLIATPITDVAVTDEFGNAYPYSVLNHEKGKRIKIGDPDKYVSGLKTYVINYTVGGGAVRYFSDHDEFYWNVTGNGWPVAMQKVDSKIYFPKNERLADVQERCYVGIFGSKRSCQRSAALLGAGGELAGYAFEASQLNPTEGLTVVVSLPKGVVNRPSIMRIAWAVVWANKIAFLPIIILITMFLLWWFKGRDPSGKGVIIPEYEPPAGLTPLELGTIVDDSVNKNDLSAEIIHLAVNGYLQITRVKTGFSPDYIFKKIKNADDKMLKIDADLLGALFKNGDTIQISELKKTPQKTLPVDIQTITQAVYNGMVEKGYFKISPFKVRFGFGILTAVFIVIGISGKGSVIETVSLILSGALVFLFGFFMPRRTPAGVALREKVLGLKMYLTVAEKDRLAFHNAPEKNPSHFEKLLPFAMVLGVEEKWVKQFDGILTENPGWYNDPTSAHFNAAVFSAGLHNFGSSTSGFFAAGGSGMSGGGSGGGGGGGGGGSW